MRGDYSVFTLITLMQSGYSAISLFLAVFLIQVKDVPVSSVGVVYIVSGVVLVLILTLSGKLSDLIGTKTMTIFSAAGSAAVCVLLSAFLVMGMPALAYIITYPFLGLFTTLPSLSLSSYMSDRKGTGMPNGLSLIYSGTNLGYAIGPVSGGFVISIFGYFGLFLFGFLVSGATLAVSAFGLRENSKYARRVVFERNPDGSRFHSSRSLMPLLFLIFLSWFVISYQGVPISVYESTYIDLSSIDIGLILTTNGLLIIILQPSISKLVAIEKRHSLIPIALGSLLMSGGFVLFAIFRTFLLLEAAISITTMGEMMIAVQSQIALSLFSRANSRGSYQGYYFAFSRAGASLAFYTGPLSFAVFAPTVFVGWYAVTIISICAAVGYFVLSPFFVRDLRNIEKGLDPAI